MAGPTVSTRLRTTDFLRNFSWQFLFNFQSSCQKFAESKSPKKYFSYFVLMFGLGLEPWFSSNKPTPLNPCFSSSKPTHYLLEHSDFNFILFTLHNWSLQPFSENNDPTSHSNHVVFVNFIHMGRNLQFKVYSEEQMFEKLIMAVLFTLRVSARNLLRGSRRRNIKM